MKHLTRGFSLVATIAIVVTATAQTHGPAASDSFSCQSKSCQEYRELAKARDPDVVAADMVCFYEGNNPANTEEATPTTDEFFLLQHGRRSTMTDGLHPGIFVNVVNNGIPEGYSGYGPMHGGEEESDAVKENSVSPGAQNGFANTYDDLRDSMRFAHFVFAPQSVWTGKEFKYTEALIRIYDETLIRKSTGRFVRRITDFDSASQSELGGREVKSERYTGRCFGTRPHLHPQ
jgi:hypothetical protein